MCLTPYKYIYAALPPPRPTAFWTSVTKAAFRGTCFCQRCSTMHFWAGFPAWVPLNEMSVGIMGWPAHKLALCVALFMPIRLCDIVTADAPPAQGYPSDHQAARSTWGRAGRKRTQCTVVSTGACLECTQLKFDLFLWYQTVFKIGVFTWTQMSQ